MKTVKNKYKVPVNLWKKFGTLGQVVFNETMDSTLKNQGLLISPKQKPMSSDHWEVICWNISSYAVFSIMDMDIKNYNPLTKDLQ